MNPFQLHKEDWPRRIELALSQESLEKLQALSARSGLSLGEVITTILDSQLQASAPAPADPEREREREGGGKLYK